jgi:hypothetical protein
VRLARWRSTPSNAGSPAGRRWRWAICSATSWPFVAPSLRAAPWRFAFGVAFALAAVITLARVGADDPYDGLHRGLIEAAAVPAGLGLLGRYLGLRSG